MNYSEEAEVIKGENFKTFWECLDFLLLAGYTNMDAFAISLLLFDEIRMWDDLAFFRLEGYVHESEVYIVNNEIIDIDDIVQQHPLGSRRLKHENKIRVIVGILDDNTRKMGKLFDMYQFALSSGKNYIDDGIEIENRIKIITIGNLSELYIRFIGELSKKHFGYNISDGQLDTILGEMVRDKERSSMQARMMNMRGDI